MAGLWSRAASVVSAVSAFSRAKSGASKAAFSRTASAATQDERQAEMDGEDAAAVEEMAAAEEARQRQEQERSENVAAEEDAGDVSELYETRPKTGARPIHAEFSEMLHLGDDVLDADSVASETEHDAERATFEAEKRARGDESQLQSGATGRIQTPFDEWMSCNERTRPSTMEGVAAEVAKLAQLRDAGECSVLEYETAKEQLLSRFAYSRTYLGKGKWEDRLVDTSTMIYTPKGWVDASNARPKTVESTAAASGLQWRNIGPQEPVGCEQLHDPSGELAASLQITVEFGEEDWALFGITKLRMDHYIKSGNSYFMPRACTPVAEVKEDALDADWSEERKMQEQEAARLRQEAAEEEHRRNAAVEVDAGDVPSFMSPIRPKTGARPIRADFNQVLNLDGDAADSVASDTEEDTPIYASTGAQRPRSQGVSFFNVESDKDRARGDLSPCISSQGLDGVSLSTSMMGSKDNAVGSGDCTDSPTLNQSGSESSRPMTGASTASSRPSGRRMTPADKKR